MGLPLALATAGFTPRALDLVPTLVEVARLIALEEERPGRMASPLVRREPVGGVAAIAPGKAPLLKAIVTTVPAPLMGCTVVYKPAPETPLEPTSSSRRSTRPAS